MSTQHTNGKKSQVVTLNRTETHGVICAALFMDYNSIFNGRNNEIIRELTKGRVDNALHLSIIALANHKIRNEYQDVTELEEPMFDDAGNRMYPVDIDDSELCDVAEPEYDSAGFSKADRYKPDDTFGGPRSLDNMYDESDNL